jgi:hypothetical protein
MSEQTTTPTASEPSTSAATASAPDAGIGTESASSPEGLAPATASAVETIRIGDHDIPLSLLESLPDEALRRIKRKIRAGGEDLEISMLDAWDSAPLAKGAQKKLWEASQVRKQAEQAAQLMAGDPVEATMRLHGVSRGQAIDMIATKLEPYLLREAMSPEERAQAERADELERKAALADRYEAQDRARREEAETAKARTTILAGLDAAFKGAGVAKTKYAIQRAAHLLDRAIQDGAIRGAPSQGDLEWAAKAVAAEVREDAEGLIPADAEGEALIAHVGEARAAKIAKAYAARVAAKSKPARAPEGTRTPAAKAAQQLEGESWAQWKARRNAEMGGRR